MIVQSVAEIENNPDYHGENIYYKGKRRPDNLFFP